MRKLAVYRGSYSVGFSPEGDAFIQELRLKLGDWPALDAVHVGQERLVTRRVPAGCTTWQKTSRCPAKLFCCP
ncbi:MAG: hypothetical protein R3D55_23975 [Chloroflexota bacterium]